MSRTGVGDRNTNMSLSPADQIVEAMDKTGAAVVAGGAKIGKFKKAIGDCDKGSTSGDATIELIAVEWSMGRMSAGMTYESTMKAIVHCQRVVSWASVIREAVAFEANARFKLVTFGTDAVVVAAEVWSTMQRMQDAKSFLTSFMDEWLASPKVVMADVIVAAKNLLAAIALLEYK